ncbi:MAG: hypothetical protein LAC69_07930 [Chlorobium sp.]|nr:hypothetical protein [Chlorobium sp.]
MPVVSSTPCTRLSPSRLIPVKEQATDYTVYNLKKGLIIPDHQVLY